MEKSFDNPAVVRFGAGFGGRNRKYDAAGFKRHGGVYHPREGVEVHVGMPVDLNDGCIRCEPIHH